MTMFDSLFVLALIAPPAVLVAMVIAAAMGSLWRRSAHKPHLQPHYTASR